MKVSKFIKKLKKLPQDLEVIVFPNPMFAWEYESASPFVKRVNGEKMCIISPKVKK